MQIEKMNLKCGKSIYPRFLEREGREKLRAEIGSDKEYMWCACRSDQKLYYLVSESLSIYPAHKGYSHAINCKRYEKNSGERKSAFVTTDDKEAMVYLKFNPKNFSLPEQETIETAIINTDIDENCQPDADIEEENEKDILPVAKKSTKKTADLEYSLDNFVRCINFDTFMQYLVTKEKIIPYYEFPKQVYYRLLNVRANRLSKPISSLTLDDDGVRFFYAPFKGVDKKSDNYSTSYHIKIQGNNDKEYGLFTFAHVYEKAYKKYIKQYGEEPKENTMVAGFQYLRKSRKNTNYKVVGRMVLFDVNKNGIYCRTPQEIQLYNALFDYVNVTKGVHITLPAEDNILSALIEHDEYKRKLLLIFPTLKKEVVDEYDSSLYEIVILDTSTTLEFVSIHRLVERIKE